MDRREKPVIFFNPVFKQAIWGGSRLGRDFPYQIPGEDTGECWAVSAHPNGDCFVREGKYEGRRLSELWTDCPELFGGTGKDRFPLLVKLIDTRTDLSIQVHPDDAYAKEHENGSSGKTECWYVLDCKPDSSLVAGHNARSRSELRRLIANSEWDGLIREIPVRRGDFLQIEPGTVHALKGGMLVLEIQQNSDITYRIYDYGRLAGGKPRELQIEKSIDVITVPARPAGDIVKQTDETPNRKNLLFACNYYKVWKMDVTDRAGFVQDEPFLICSVVEGEGSLNGQPVQKGDHFILPAGYGEVSLKGKLQIIMTAAS